MPTWVFHAEPDGHVHIRESELAVEAVSKVNSNIRFTRYPDAPDVDGHDCWTRGYADHDMIEWLTQQTNPLLQENGLEWGREQALKLLGARCANTIQQAALVDPFKFKRALGGSFAKKLRRKSTERKTAGADAQAPAPAEAADACKSEEVQMEASSEGVAQFKSEDGGSTDTAA
eukprot:TRINITY_DN1618_c0_g1_i1.p2 TRINITY_DN1618_c0_g1~~TRINITY_DN1618_c0_g1_i1.p2  ORF type:complete len:174 (-),score=37.30 TRINITY_DN1618_c0_g1_i1:468-989(-)